MAKLQATKVLLHLDDSEPVADVINGLLIELPAGEPVELDEFTANAVLDHKALIHGIVEVKQIKTKTGVQYDIEEAEVRAQEALAVAEDRSVQFYVRQQMEDRIAGGKPALPPNGRARSIVLRKGISLREQFGLTPVGWKDVNDSNPNVESTPTSPAISGALQSVVSSQKETIATLETQVEMQQNQLAAMDDKLNKLLRMFEDAPDPDSATTKSPAQEAAKP